MMLLTPVQLLSGKSGSFTPLAIFGGMAKGWWRLNALPDGIAAVQNPFATVDTTSGATTISQLTNLVSPGTGDLAQTTKANQPLAEYNFFNNRSVLRISATNQGMSANLALNGSVWWVLVWHRDSTFQSSLNVVTQYQDGFFAYQNTGGCAPLLADSPATGNRAGQESPVSTYSTIASVSNGVWRAVVSEFDAAGDQIRLDFNAGAVNASAAWSGSLSNSDRVSIGMTGNNAYYSHPCRLAEIICGTGVISAAQKNDLYRYLRVEHANFF
ncbi:MAG: hypothetical protein AB7G80_05000 [Dongiaceae bacterium]